MIRLSDIQLVLLASAAQRPDGSLLPPPERLGDQPARIARTITALLKRDLVREAEANGAGGTWRQDGDRTIGAFITDAGRTAIDGAPVADQDVGPTVADRPLPGRPDRPATKITQVLALLRRSEGATLAELTAVTGWLPHTTRAALTRLRQMGHVLDRAKRGDVTRYAIVEAA